jgi:hypothetical protein
MRPDIHIRRFALVLGLLSCALGCSSRSDGGSSDANVVASTAQALAGDTLSTAPLQLAVSKNSCYGNGAQDNFNVLNAGSSGAKLSDITIKYWVYDTSGSPVVPHVWYGGCVSSANGTCTHQVTGVSASVASFPACGPDASHQANWEITVSTTDTASVPPGSSWGGVQTGINLGNFANFSPGSANWYSSCGTGQPYGADSHFAVYSQGNLVASSGISAPACRAPHGAQQLSGYLSKHSIVNAPIVGPVPPTTPVSFSIALPLKAQNADGLSLDAFIKQASDPTSPKYRQYLTPATFATSFGPDPQSYQQLVAWANSVGLTVVQQYSNNSLLTLSGTAATVESALFTNLVLRTRPDGTVFFSSDREPSLAFPLQVLRISGLDNFAVSTAADIPCPPAAPQGSPTQNGTGDDGLFRGSDYRNLYASCTSLDGGGPFPQSIALFELDNFNQLDVSQYLTRSGLPDKTINVATVGASGDAHQFINGPEEVLLDIDLAASMAPGATVSVYGKQGPDKVDYHNGLIGLMTNAAPLPNVISSSWFFDVDDETTQLLGQLAAQGQSFFEASGDSGSYDNTGDPEDIRDLPYLTLVGATVVSTSGVGGPLASESGWSGSSGGQFEGTEGVFGIGHVDNQPLPDYQQGVVSSPGTGVEPNLRNAPDVAMLGANALIYRGCTPDAVGGIRTGTFTCPVEDMCGTSAAAPLWAAFTALVDQQTEASGIGPMGFVNPVLYGIEKNATVYASSFNDITSGSNPDPAKAGYDLVTGIGSPKCELIQQLASTTPTLPIVPNSGPPKCSSAQMALSGAAGQLAGRGPIICGTGTGFSPLGGVDIEYIGVPGGQPAQSHLVANADASGNVQFLDTTQENDESPVPCTAAQELQSFVSVVITDEVSGCTITELEEPGFWCPNSSLAQFGNGC